MRAGERFENPCPAQHALDIGNRLVVAVRGIIARDFQPVVEEESSERVMRGRFDVQTPVASTIFRESKPQQTGTVLLIRLGEVATTSDSTNPCLVV